jgi:predicted DNA-binding protein (UPF0251 family)
MNDLECVELQQDELEALRLCDKEGLTQAEAGGLMAVSLIYATGEDHDL